MFLFSNYKKDYSVGLLDFVNT